MALFGKKTNKENKAVAPKAEASYSAPKNSPLIIPRITEKATFLAEKNVYVFNIPKGASKGVVLNSLRAQYKVTPLKINIVNQMGKKVTAKGRIGRSVDTKKAYVYLKEGDKIELA